MNSVKLPVLVLAAILLICLSGCFSAYGSGQTEASGKMADADHAIMNAFGAVVEAEKAKANVTDLVLRLDSAGALLAKAETAFRVGDYGNATVWAQQSLEQVQGVESEAQSLKSDAEIAGQNQLIITGAFSSIGVVLLLAVGLFGWRYLKNRFVRNVMKMKPEVAQI